MAAPADGRAGYSHLISAHGKWLFLQRREGFRDGESPPFKAPMLRLAAAQADTRFPPTYRASADWVVSESTHAPRSLIRKASAGDVTLPGHEFLVGRGRADHHAHEDAHVAVRAPCGASSKITQGASTAKSRLTPRPNSNAAGATAQR
jgi:hypothetical protein